MRFLYYRTGGLSHRALAGAQNTIARLRNPRPPRPVLSETLFNLNADAAGGVVKDLKRRGFYFLAGALRQDVCGRLERFARTTAARPRLATPAPGQAQTPRSIFNSAAPAAAIYDFDMSALLQCEDVQLIATDPILLQVARSYLGPAARLYSVAMWWSAAKFLNPDQNRAAQMFHNDLDTVSWLNFFMYLTDVGSGDGPHVYVEGSHVDRRGSTFRDGRISDAEVEERYPLARHKEFIGQKGALLIEDTRGMHKGKTPTQSDRLMFELVFSTSLLGNTYEGPAVREHCHPVFLSRLHLHGFVYTDLIRVPKPKFSTSAAAIH
jgi:hypothetical protein